MLSLLNHRITIEEGGLESRLLLDTKSVGTLSGLCYAYAYSRDSRLTISKLRTLLP